MIDKIPIKPDLTPDFPISTKEKVMNPAADLVGQALRGIGLKVLGPLLRYQIYKEEEMNDYTKKIKEKTGNIPLANRDSSKIGLTLKAVEDSAYQLSTEELRNMFSNLISASVDSRKNPILLPSFSTILKDFSADDARLFKTLYKINAVAKVDIQLVSYDRSAVLPCLDNLMVFDDYYIKHDPISINTLHRLGLIKIENASLIQPNFKSSYDHFRKTDNQYTKFAREQLTRFKDETPSYDEIKIIEGYITMTKLGQNLGKLVVSQ
ncbi:MAG: DUF4393 domain-containing protein [Alkalibacterium sp.]|nr:DUF4393 domain-containing protein [Alkalibacterium sp.]